MFVTIVCLSHGQCNPQAVNVCHNRLAWGCNNNNERLWIALSPITRQSVLDSRTVDKCGPAEAAVITHFLSIFFFVCRIPFFVLDNYFFRQFIRVIRPSYVEFLPGRDAMRTTLLRDLYDETTETTQVALARIPGRLTVGIDGKTDNRGRATVNVTKGKVGIVSYIKTVWGKKNNTRESFTRTLFRMSLVRVKALSQWLQTTPATCVLCSLF